MSWSAPVTLTPPRRRRWPIVVGALAAVVTVAAAALVVIWWTRDGEIGPRPDWQPPAQTFLASSMDVRPVPGWRTTVTDLGLPASAPGSPLSSRISTSDEQRWSDPFVGSLGDSGYFLAQTSGEPDTQWWLAGVDVRDGRRLFAPIQLDTGEFAPKCFLNGPDALLCIRQQTGSATAWVISAQTGEVTYTGPTDLRTSTGKLGVVQVGIYAVAQTMNQGAFGVGPRAETTWFVPGAGDVRTTFVNSNIAPQTRATQTTGGRGSDRMVVFSVLDGAVITPELDEGLRPLAAVSYPGGFAVEVVEQARKSTADGVAFFDDVGKQLGRVDVSGFLSRSSMDVPIVGATPDSLVFSRDGFELAKITRFYPGSIAILIGNRLFVTGPSDGTPTKQYNLQNGSEGKECDIYIGAYVGSDGTVGVFGDGNPGAAPETTAIDLASCEPRWTITSPKGSFRDMWRVNTTLVQLSDDGTELMSLVAPS